MKYVALLRGINSGKNPMIKMDVLRSAFENMGFKKVKTVIASGNIIFESDKTTEKKLEEKIEKELPKLMGFQSNAIVRTIEDIEKIVKRNPFKNVPATPFLRLHVTFLKAKPGNSFKFMSEPGLQAMGIFDRVICYMIDLENNTTPKVMGILDKKFNKETTTRTWKTIERILKAAE